MPTRHFFFFLFRLIYIRVYFIELMESKDYEANFCPTCGKRLLVRETASKIIQEHVEPVLYCQNENCGMTYFKVILL